MKYIRFSISTTTEAVDYISAMLYDLGVQGIEIEDKVPLTEAEKKQMFIDILPEECEDDGTATVRFYVEPDTDVETLKLNVAEGLSEVAAYADCGSARLTIDDTDDEDWLNNWKAFFKPFRIDDKIVVKPTWEKLECRKSSDIIIEIDPGTAFGTGSHETTKLCILELEEWLHPGNRLLDIGCGSGILSIVGDKLGACGITAVDVDKIAVKVTDENLRVNNIAQDVTLYDGDVITDEELREEVGLGCYDVVVANILADIIIPLSGVVKEFMKLGGIFISSGIIINKKEAVLSALAANGFKVLKVRELGDWVSVTAQAI